MTSPPDLLVDVGSTMVKTCTRLSPDRFSPVRAVPRQPGLAPGEQVRELVERHHRAGPLGAVRVSSSAGGGLRVAVVGLSRRHSVAAATRAVLDGGGTVVHRGVLPDDGGPAPPADVLVLVGGVDGADHRRLRAALPALRLDRYPHRLLVWAGADAPDVLARLPPHRRAANVLGSDLRPRPDGLARVVREAYLDDLVDAKGLGALAGLTRAPIWPTPAVVGLAAERMTRRPVPLAPALPFLVVDVGGATTDVFVCAELLNAPGRHGAPGTSLVRHVFPDLGVVPSAPALLHRLVVEPELVDLTAAAAPQRARALREALWQGDPAALAPPVGFLACVFLALRRLAGSGGVDLTRAGGLVVTGGAWRGSSPDAIRRVVALARGTPVPPAALLVDRRYTMWAHGIQHVPPRTG